VRAAGVLAKGRMFDMPALNNESVQEGILCDLTKVFVCVHRGMSLSKLGRFHPFHRPRRSLGRVEV